MKKYIEIEGFWGFDGKMKLPTATANAISLMAEESAQLMEMRGCPSSAKTNRDFAQRIAHELEEIGYYDK